MMTLGEPFIEKGSEKSRLCCKVTIEENSSSRDFTLWYEADNKYCEYLCCERQDAMLVTLLTYAMHYGHDIICQAPVSGQLLYQIVQFYIPAMVDNLPQWHKNIKIIAHTTSEQLVNAGAVGTAVSCGVDSFYSIYENLDPIVPQMKLTHLVLLNAGGTGNSGDEKPRIWYNKKIDAILPYIEETGLEFVGMDTNINEIYNNGDEGCHYSGVTRTLGCILALQKLFHIYHCPSAYELKDMAFDDEPQKHELLNMICFSNENLLLLSSGMQLSRIDKVKEIAKYEPSYYYLNVCNHGFDNCSNCEKCIRTMTELYANGCLELYSNVFNVEYYKSNFGLLMGRYIFDKSHNLFYTPIRKKLDEAKISIPTWSYLYYHLYRKPYVYLRQGLKNNIFVRKIYERLGGLERFPPIR